MLNPNYNAVITLYNCLHAKDNPGKKDIWKKTVLQSCFFKASTAVSQNGTEATVSNVYTARIPQSEEYMSYAEWAAAGGSAGFTVSEGDIVVLGECPDDITGESPNTASQVLARNKPDAFKVTAFSDNTRHIAGKHYRLGG